MDRYWEWAKNAIDTAPEDIQQKIGEMIAEETVKGFRKGFSEVFSWNGEVHKAIKEHANNTMSKVIEGVRFDEYIPKMETVLTELLNDPALRNAKEILIPFKEMFSDMDIETIKVSELFKAYKKYVEENGDTDGREVITDGDVTYYEYFPVEMEVEPDESRKYSSFEWLTIHFRVDEEEQETLNRDVVVSRWKNSRDEGYTIHNPVSPEIKGLRYMSKFDILLAKIGMAGTRILVDVESDSDDVESDNTPEADWS